MTPNNNYNKRSGGLFVPTNGGKNAPKQIHVAHRRSQSELTNLMIEQFTLQRQLEIVQAQQQHIMAQQQQLAQQASQYLNTNNSNNNTFIPQIPNPYFSSNNYMGSPKHNNNGSNRNGGHSRNNSGYHNNGNNYNQPPVINVQDSDGNKQYAYGHSKNASQSSIYGHSRRHSLGLNEAKKAAAEEQAKRSAPEQDEKTSARKQDGSSNNNKMDPPPGFKFPASTDSTSQVLSPQKRSTSQGSDAGQFKFPPSSGKSDSNDSDDNFTRVSHHQTSKSKGNDQNRRNNSQSSYQLSPFRHRQTNSKDYNSFSALEPPAVFQPGHKNRPSNSSIQSFGSHATNNGSGQRKPLFAPYLPQANIPELIQEGRLVAGVLRVNKKNRSDAWVSTDGILDSDIYICGSKDRNRALEGDLVAVELLVVDDVWESKKEKEEKKRRKDAAIQQDIIPLDGSDDYHNDASTTSTNNVADDSATSSPTTPQVYSNNQNSSSALSDSDSQSPTKSSIKRRGSLKQRPTQKKNDDVEVEGQSLLLVEEEEINDDFKPLYAGHIVAVLDRIPGQLFSGTLGLLRPSQQAQSENTKLSHAPKIVWFKPTDKKVPLIAIPTELAPKDFVENADKYTDKLFVAALKRWPITSLHPFGIIVSELGNINDPETQMLSILRDKNFLSNEYIDPKNPSQERSTFQANKIQPDAMKKRRKFTSEEDYDVVAITPDNNLSELAFHLRTVDDSTIEFGCHVVDVTAHIEEGLSLDRRARKRSSAVFMPQTTVNLLPKTLNESLKLDQNKTSATLSVVYSLDVKSLEVKSCWIGETVISPSSVISIDDITDDKSPNHSGSLSTMKKIARSFYQNRIQNDKAELIPELPLFDSLDDERVKVELNILDKKLGYVVVEEIERFVNNTIAKELYNNLGERAFLRRQASPTLNKMENFKRKVQKLGYEVNISSPSSLINSILKIDNDDIRIGVEILLFKSMPRAKYFVAGKVDVEQYDHFAFNFPLYTHFTAPLRRYADHVVHRQLKSILSGKSYEEDVDTLKITSEYCNFKKDCAYEAQQQALHLLLSNTINDMGNATGQLLTMATVLQVYESSFDIFIPEFGIEKRVHGDQLPLIKAEFDPVNRVLELYWQSGVDSATFIPNDEKNPKSYRNSIKNKFRSSTEEIANMVITNKESNTSLLSEKMTKDLVKMDLSIPHLRFPDYDPKAGALSSFINTAVTRKDNDNCIQEIHELQQIPVLLRAEIGMALPCLTVCALNPFLKNTH
ncbi:hypothetical protein Kpol_1023p50 [Vanderwaltozyma polyspora DSM 70294]|uniref:RNB domain-containing protein n=1 Tax=Vanderwaltozyma polyspora (strain ATCC 22028 / DSM 70294 / BCRC 21397 / CBS 2163 / NBRC 10782 / NRRL Y-8283 / UCD 57-17) TaxID=436907 RepID=A7TFS3_VANPO|nr:uncharacterized protein Kpol_1023p50 [Vanderwaltozyma polyspora DSM 70294]EDO18881.1 hypothetical protein Kpol_1023p50 [Vanderwaltozyma polyspora DSM 70294]